MVVPAAVDVGDRRARLEERRPLRDHDARPRRRGARRRRHAARGRAGRALRLHQHARRGLDAAGRAAGRHRRRVRIRRRARTAAPLPVERAALERGRHATTHDGWASPKAGASAPTSSARSPTGWRRQPMRRIVGGVFQSLDGVMQAPGGPSEDPTGGFDLWRLDVPVRRRGGRRGDRRAASTASTTCCSAAGPTTSSPPSGPIDDGDEDGSDRRGVQPRREIRADRDGDQPLDWENSHRLRDIDAVAALKASDGPDLVIQGSEHALSGAARGGAARPADDDDLPA